MKILLLGANGQLGRELTRALAPLGQVIVLNREPVDLAHPEHLSARLKPYAAEVIVNAAAYTAVDKAEQEPALAMAINAAAVATIADHAFRTRALLVHYSTDYVFDGTQRAPYTEADAPTPLNVYGQSKLAGEQAVQASGCDYLLLRTSWLYAAHGNNFVRRILQLAQTRGELKVVNDQWGCPTNAGDLADATAQLIQSTWVANNWVANTVAGATRHPNTGFRSELYHLCGQDHTNWFEFASAAVVEAQNHGLLKRLPVLLPLTSEEYPTAAKRPRNAILDTRKIKHQQGIVLPHWRDSLKQTIGVIARA